MAVITPSPLVSVSILEAKIRRISYVTVNKVRCICPKNITYLVDLASNLSLHRRESDRIRFRVKTSGARCDDKLVELFKFDGGGFSQEVLQSLCLVLGDNLWQWLKIGGCLRTVLLALLSREVEILFRGQFCIMGSMGRNNLLHQWVALPRHNPPDGEPCHPCGPR